MSSTTIVKAPVIPTWSNITVTAPSVTTIPAGYYDGTRSITANGWLNPFYTNIEMNVSGMVVMSDTWSWGYDVWFISWATIIWWNLYQVFDMMHKDDNSNSSTLWHYTVIVKRTAWGVITKYSQFRATWTFNSSFTNKTTINVNGNIIQIHSAFGAWFFRTFDTTTDTFNTWVSWISSSIISHSDYVNYWTSNAVNAWTGILSTNQTWAISWSAIPSSIVFSWNTYWWTRLNTYIATGWWAWQSTHIAFSTKL